MKIYIKFLFISILILYMAACAKKSEIKKIEETLVALYDNDNDNDDYYMEFERKFTKLILSDTNTINYPFQQLEERNCVRVTSSKDGNLRFYSWVTPFGGTMLDYADLFQYRSEGKVFSFSGTPCDYDENGNSIPPIEGCNNSCTFVKIHTVKIGDKTYYLVEKWARYDGRHGVGSINTFTIENGKLREVKLFKTKTETLSSIHIEYTFSDWYFRANNGEGDDWLFAFDETTNTLHVPLINNDIAFGYVTDQYLLYQLKGNYLQYVGKNGGYWLHSSIRKFDHLVNLFETKKFKIRIDATGNEAYRYASWKKGKPMSDKPDLVLENGVRNGEGEQCFIFSNDEYTYTVANIDEKTCLTVNQGNKEILKQYQWESTDNGY